jgi:hypothetical protein
LGKTEGKTALSASSRPLSWLAASGTIFDASLGKSIVIPGEHVRVRGQGDPVRSGRAILAMSHRTWAMKYVSHPPRPKLLEMYFMSDNSASVSGAFLNVFQPSCTANLPSPDRMR